MTVALILLTGFLCFLVGMGSGWGIREMRLKQEQEKKVLVERTYFKALQEIEASQKRRGTDPPPDHYRGHGRY